MHLTAKRIVRMEFGSLDQNKVFWCRDGVDPGDGIMVGQAEKIVSLVHIAVQPLLVAYSDSRGQQYEDRTSVLTGPGGLHSCFARKRGW